MAVASVTLAGVQIEGNLIAPDLTSELLAGNFKGQAIEDFGFSRADKLADEIAVAWGDAKAYWAAFQRALGRLPEDDPATTVTREQWAVPLLRSLGYDPIYTAKAEVVDGQTYAISHRTNPGEDKPPIHILGCRVGLEQRPPSGTPRLSAHALMQEYLNRTEHLWGVVTNGLQWRLLRDSSLMTRLTYVEFDLEQILSGENFAEFGLFYRLFHRSRLPQGMEDADECLLEFYHQETLQQGGRVRDRLRDGVEKALIQLGTGFLQHPENEGLRQKVESGQLSHSDYYRQLLKLIYRLLFLMVAESRDLLLDGQDAEKARIYQEYYSIDRLRAMVERPTWRREGFQDLWQGLRVTFRLFDENWRGKLLGLSPLNGDLFGSKSLLDLDDCAIDNHDLLLSVRCLSLYEQKGQLRRVNYGALDVEELGSVYESLLDFCPQIVQQHGFWLFLLVVGSDRKTTGSYYTPPELVGQLIKSALEPVIEAKLQAVGSSAANREVQEQALLSLKICDPACGSGHFLLAAARRVGKELARVRTGEAQPGAKMLREAIRDVIQHCIYGVDLNPLAVDLCKVALWIEGLCHGMSLNFLDHRIKCGNSLVGVLDLDCLKEGIPDEAYKAVTGDNKQLSSQLKKRNKQERKDFEAGQLFINFEEIEKDRPQYAESAEELNRIKDDDPPSVREKAEKYWASRYVQSWLRDYSACNLWTAAFFMPVTECNLPLLPTSAALESLLQGDWATQKTMDVANQLAEEKRFFHWALEFPDVFEQGGFDCVLGNPPWERIKLQEKEFFASRSVEIAKAVNKAEREKLIKELPKKNPALAKAFEAAKHDAEAQSKFIRESSRFPLTAVGDVNTYAVFTETVTRIISPVGQAGIIIPSAIVTADTTKDFFSHIATNGYLSTVLDFAEIRDFFIGVGSPDPFCLFVIRGKGEKEIPSNFVFKALKLAEIQNSLRKIQLLPQDFIALNPNTKTCPIFRTNNDAELVKKIYKNVPIIENEFKLDNPWKLNFKRGLFDMTNDSSIFTETPLSNSLPLYEAKMIYGFDHRFGSYETRGDERGFATLPATPEEKYQDVGYKVKPFYWVEKSEVENRTGSWNKDWLIVFRGVTKALNERTAICTVLPKVGVGNSLSVIFPSENTPKLCSCLVSNFNSLVFDFITRQKMSGVNLNIFIVKQLPVIPPDRYTQTDIEFISSRVLELVYTAYDLKPFAQDMGYDGEPCLWNPDRRALLRAELDAYYAKLYGLTRDELRYILDPADVYGPDFPSETFRVLKNNEIKQFGEYRTQRLVLEAWDRMFG
ncbi:Eco57I restriction-modification methylase domain-containing protein [Leptolyngbya ohadii]|uniref:Eco57I restriction-modification methylase domain-containing protein n=1 Tax=Leptolyngbya ohadii TaxID=1962290 RepID=UPI0015C6702C|nr:N-6 DNA methylase [Leptolyngbya ohadii]